MALSEHTQTLHRDFRKAGKRPRSSMSPTLVFEEDTGKLLIGTVPWALNTQQALNLPSFSSLDGPTILEEKRFSTETIKALQSMGHEIRETPLPSGLQAIEVTSTGLFWRC